MKQRYNINIDKEIHDKAVKACKLIEQQTNVYSSLSSQIEIYLDKFIDDVENTFGVKL